MHMHTNVSVVTWAGALKTLIIAAVVAYWPELQLNAVLQDALGTVVLGGICWLLPGDFGLRSKIVYSKKLDAAHERRGVRQASRDGADG